MTGRSRSGSNTRTDSEKLPSENRPTPRARATAGSPRACCRPRRRADQGVPDVQEDQLAVAVEVERAVAGGVALAPDVVEGVEQREGPLEVAEVEDVLLADSVAVAHRPTSCRPTGERASARI
jgi:hypothetical protein